MPVASEIEPLTGYTASASFGQQRLHAMETLRPGLTAYAMGFALRLDGALEPALVRQAIAAIVARHDGLRSSFVTEDDVLRVFVADVLPVAVPLLDVSALAPPARREAVNAALRRLTLAPFDLAAGPLLRLQLIRLEPAAHVLVLAVHHAIFDGQSLGLFRAEFAALYDALALGRPAPLAELPIQVADFAEWERSAARDESSAAYWRARLADVPGVLDLPLDGERDGRDAQDGDPSGATLLRDLPPDVVERLLAVGRAQRATPAMTFLAVLAALIGRWCLSEDIVIALPVSKRSRPELAGMIGMLVDLLPLRMRIPAGTQFTGLLGTARDALLEAMQYSNVPFERIVELAAVQRRADAQPFQQVLFGFEAAPADQAAGGVLAMSEWDDVPEQDSKADLSFLVCRDHGRWRVALRYTRALFSPATAARLLDWFATLCRSAADGPETRLTELALAAEADTRALLQALNATARPLPAGTLAALFEQCAAATPTGAALTVFEGGAATARTLDYAALNRRANRLAHYLAARGVRRGRRVALAIPAGIDFIVAVLAVIKLGAAYVPLDSELPAVRRAAMLEDAGVDFIVLAGGELPRRVTEEREVIDLGRAQTLIARSDPGNPPNRGDAGDLAYVMFTSGSTGTPKGVAVPQRAIVRLVRNSDFLGVTAGDAVGFASNVSFDASTLEIWGALLNGARLLQVPRDVLFSAAELKGFIAQRRLTVLWVTKGVFDQLVRGDAAVFSGLRVVLTGGEAASPGAFNRVLAASAGSGLVLLNGYGPTENTTFSNVWRPRAPLPEGKPVPIGRAIANSRAYVLDDALRPVPAGIPGELYVAGDGLADGYAGRSDLTAERFLPDPFATQPGQRMYRTGDLARLLDDGSVAYLGRIDHQVKIRGFRIELSEISAALARHPSVAGCHIAVHDDGECGKRLNAYVVPRPGETLTSEALREHLRANLPEFMLPKSIVVLDALPLNANGKIDTRALPVPGPDETGDTASHEPPRGPTETALAAIWAQVVKLPRVGRDDNFFHLGGDSILTIRVAARARDRGLPVTPKLLFQHQTIAGLAAAVDALLAEHSPVPCKRVLPLTGSQYRLARLAMPAAGGRAEGRPAAMPSGTLWAAGWAVSEQRTDGITLGLALRDLRRRHDALRLGVGGNATLRVLEVIDVPPPVPVSLHRLDPALSGVALDRALQSILDALAAGLDARGGTVFRGALIQETPARQRILLLVHRLVADEASVALLMHELGRGLVEWSRDGSPAPAFSAWIERVAAYASGPDLAAQLTVWDHPARREARFKAAPAAAPTASAPREARHRLHRLLTGRLAPAALFVRRITPLEIVLAALAAALEPLGRQATPMLIDIVTDGRISSRADLDLTGMVGNFSRRFPVLMACAEGGDALERLALAKSALRDLPDGGLGFELLNRDLASLPSSSVVLLDGLPAGPVQGSGVLREVRVQGRPPVEGGAWIVLRLERDADGLSLACAVQSEHRPADVPADAPDDPARLAETVAAWLDRLLAAGAGAAIVHTPADFPLAGIDRPALLKVLQGRDAVEDIYPLSPMQESMLIHALTAPDSEIGFEQACHRIDGPLDVAAFRAAWQAALDRHTILRTAFAWEGLARPLQLVHARVRFDFRVDDWSGLPAAAQESRREALLAADRTENFRLDRPPLLRAAVVRLGPGAFLFVSSFHHILLDGWCLPQLEREVRLAYEAVAVRQPPALWISRPYAEYIAWLQRQDPGKARSFFRSLLAGWPGPTPLPETSAAAAPRITRSLLALTAEESQAVSRFARMQRLTAGALLHAAWGMVLMQSSGQRDVLFGTTVSGRPPELPGVETMLGLFINNLPVRLRLDDDAPVETVLAALQAQLVELRQHEMVSPLEIETFAPGGAAGRMFDSLLVVENVPSALHEWAASPALRFTLLSSPLKTRYALTLVAIPGDRLSLSLVHDGNRFAASVAAGMLAEMRRLLLAMTESNGRSMASLLRLRVQPAAVPATPPPGPRPEAPGRVLPRNTIEVQVAHIVAELLGLPCIGVTDDFVPLGMTSVTVSRLALRLHQTFGRALPLTHIITHATVAQLAVSLSERDSPALAWQPLVPMGRGDGRRSFYCVHPIAGDVSVFFDLARAMMPARRFVALQAPGLRPGDPEPDSLEALAALYVDVLAADSPEPIDIGGYSFGGVVAFEIARQMAARGRPVRSLVIIDTPAPAGVVPPDEDYSDAAWLWRMLRVRERFHGVDLALTQQDLERTEGQASYDLVLARLREAGLLPENADAGLLLRMASVGRRHYRLYRRYRPAPIDAPMAVIRAADVDASEAEIDHGGKFRLADLGWGELTRARVLTAVTPGNHVTMMRPPDLPHLAACLERLLAAPVGRQSGELELR